MVPAPSARRTTVDQVHTWEQLDAADFSTKAAIASAAAWSPNPHAPPFFADFLMADGTVQPLVLA
jgi:hypothetical protein